MGNRRRTDQTFVTMKTTRPRDNKMYRITEGWNLDTPDNELEVRLNSVQCERNQYIIDKYQESQSIWGNSEFIVPKTVANRNRSMFKEQDTLLVSTDRHDTSTATESTKKHVYRQNGIVKVLDKQFNNTARERLQRANKQFRSQTLEEKILQGSFNPSASIARSRSKPSTDMSIN
jgi:hypothetical protein